MKLKITEMFAFVTIDDSDGSEGIIGMMKPNGEWFPFVGADLKNVESIVPLANAICKKMNKEYKILKFSKREDITK